METIYLIVIKYSNDFVLETNLLIHFAIGWSKFYLHPCLYTGCFCVLIGTNEITHLPVEGNMFIIYWHSGNLVVSTWIQLDGSSVYGLVCSLMKWYSWSKHYLSVVWWGRLMAMTPSYSLFARYCQPMNYSLTEEPDFITHLTSVATR